MFSANISVYQLSIWPKFGLMDSFLTLNNMTEQVSKNSKILQNFRMKIESRQYFWILIIGLPLMYVIQNHSVFICSYWGYFWGGQIRLPVENFLFSKNPWNLGVTPMGPIEWGHLTRMIRSPPEIKTREWIKYNFKKNMSYII